MRKYVIFLIIGAGLLSCKNDSLKESKVDYMLFSGVIENAKVDELILGIEGKYSIGLDKNGVFSDTLRFDKPSVVSLFTPTGTIEFYYKPGLDLHISFDEQNFSEPPKISGSGKKYVDFSNTLETIIPIEKELEKIRTLPEVDYVNGLKKNYKKVNDFLNQKTTLAPDYIEIKKSEVSLRYGNELLDYWKDNNLITPTVIQSELMKFNFSDVKRFKKDYLYKYFIENYFSMLSNEYAQKNNVAEYDAFATVVQTKDISQEMKEKLLNNYFLALFHLSPYTESSLAFNDLKQAKEAYFNVSENSKGKSKIAEALKIMEHLQPSMPAPNFSLSNEKGEKVSLSDFKGKYVLIDVWATWCGGCVVDLPEFKKLTEAYSHKNMVAIKISLDRNENTWKKFLKEKRLRGINLLADNSFTENYFIETISRYILIDPEGNIVTVNAPLPSSKEIRELLNTLPEKI